MVKSPLTKRQTVREASLVVILRGGYLGAALGLNQIAYVAMRPPDFVLFGDVLLMLAVAAVVLFPVSVAVWGEPKEGRSSVVCAGLVAAAAFTLVASIVWPGRLSAFELGPLLYLSIFLLLSGRIVERVAVAAAITDGRPVVGYAMSFLVPVAEIAVLVLILKVFGKISLEVRVAASAAALLTVPMILLRSLGGGKLSPSAVFAALRRVYGGSRWTLCAFSVAVTFSAQSPRLFLGSFSPLETVLLQRLSLLFLYSNGLYSGLSALVEIWRPQILSSPHEPPAMVRWWGSIATASLFALCGAPLIVVHWGADRDLLLCWVGFSIQSGAMVATNALQLSCVARGQTSVETLNWLVSTGAGVAIAFLFPWSVRPGVAAFAGSILALLIATRFRRS